MEWIKCIKGQMPEDLDTKNRKSIDVIVTTNSGKVTKVQRIHNTYRDNDYWYWGRINNGCKAWMPLPRPYKEDN